MLNKKMARRCERRADKECHMTDTAHPSADQPTLENDPFELGSEEYRGVPPKHGWDNDCDIREAKQHCRDWAFSVRATKKDEHRIFDIAYRIRQFGVSARLASDLIINIVEPPAPPFHPVHVRSIVASAYEVCTNPPGLLSQAGRTENHWTPAERDDPNDDNWLEGGAGGWPRPLLYDSKQHNSKLAEMFLAERPEKLIVSDGLLYTLGADRIWREISLEELAAEIRKTDPTLVLDTPRIFGIVQAIKLMVFTTARPFEWIEAPHDAPTPANAIPFKNGILNFESRLLLPHTGQYFATGCPEFNYDPEAACPFFDRFLDDVLDPSFHPTLLEFMGYVLTPDTSHHKLLALIGVRRGGKSTILQVMSWLVGASHVVSRTLNDMGGDFGLEGTLDKRLLVIPDASDTELSKRSVALDRIKAVTGGDEVSVNRKGVKIVSATLPTRLAIAANRHPRFLDESGALNARELVLVFERSFEGREDRELGAKLRAELPGIANRALEGLARLRTNGRFTVGERGLAAARELAESQSPALRFSKARLSVTGDPDDFVPLDIAFESYEEWCTVESLSARERRSRDDFKSDLVAALLAKSVRYERRRWRDPDSGKHGAAPKLRGFVGLRMKA
jgi:P4 family phage/plasmid primase-like protien